MAVDKKHLRLICNNYYAMQVGAGSSAVPGTLVPAGQRMYIFYVKVWQNNATPELIDLYRDGAGGFVDLDRMMIPGSGAGPAVDLGEQILQIGMNIETPIYILEPTEELGIGSPPAGPNVAILVNAFLEP